MRCSNAFQSQWRLAGDVCSLNWWNGCRVGPGLTGRPRAFTCAAVYALELGYYCCLMQYGIVISYTLSIQWQSRLFVNCWRSMQYEAVCNLVLKRYFAVQINNTLMCYFAIQMHYNRDDGSVLIFARLLLNVWNGRTVRYACILCLKLKFLILVFDAV